MDVEEGLEELDNTNNLLLKYDLEKEQFHFQREQQSKAEGPKRSDPQHQEEITFDEKGIMVIEERKRQRAVEEEREEETAAQQKDVLNFKKKTKSSYFFIQPKSIRSNNQVIHSNPLVQVVMSALRTSQSHTPSSSSAQRLLISASRNVQNTCLKVCSRRRRADSRGLNPGSPLPTTDLLILLIKHRKAI
jgi:hypothetical protein